MICYYIESYTVAHYVSFLGTVDRNHLLYNPCLSCFCLQRFHTGKFVHILTTKFGVVSTASGVNPGHLTYFRFCGRVIALALMHRVQMDVVFALTFFKQLAGLPVLWEDAKDADPCLYESCKKILEMDPEVIDTDILGLTFVSEVEELGSHKSMELCMGGKDMVVNSENRGHFVDLLVQRRLVNSVAEQVKSFSQGFSDLLVNSSHQQFLRALEPADLDLMLYGKDRNICLEDWKAHTEYHDYNASDDQIVWFWQVRMSSSFCENRT